MEDGKMYEGIVKVREQQISWAVQAAKHMAKLTQEELDLVCHDSEFAEFRACMQGPNGPSIVIEFMNVIAQTIIEIERGLVYINAHGESDCWGALSGYLEPGLGLCVWTDGWLCREMDLRGAIEERYPDVHSGIATMLIALGYVLRESTPEVWGNLRIERRVTSDEEKKTFLHFEESRWSYFVRREDALSLNRSRDEDQDLPVCFTCCGIQTEEDIRSTARCICPATVPSAA